MREERRSTPRRRAYLPVRISQTETPIIETLSKDVGLGGVCCVSPSLTPVGTEVLVELDLPVGQEVLMLRGRTVWVRVLPDSEQFDLGIRFHNMPEQAHRLLSTFIDQSHRLTPV